MVDRAYKSALPAFRKDLETLRIELDRVRPSTDWNRLRVEPLLKHVERLERLLESERFAGETARLRRGVPMFHSDLVYLRENVRALREIVRRESKAVERAP